MAALSREIADWLRSRREPITAESREAAEAMAFTLFHQQRSAPSIEEFGRCLATLKATMPGVKPGTWSIGIIH